MKANASNAFVTCGAMNTDEIFWKIKQEEQPTPPVSPTSPVAAAAGFIKRLVRQTEEEAKESRLQEKERRGDQQNPGKLDDSVVQHFLHLTQNESQPLVNSMDGRTQVLVNGLHGDGPDSQSTSTPEGTARAECRRAKVFRKPKALKVPEASGELTNADSRQHRTDSLPTIAGPVAVETSGSGQEELAKEDGESRAPDPPGDEKGAEERQEILSGQEAGQEVEGHDKEQVESEKVQDDVWYETDRVWYVEKDGFTSATVLKPDVGTPELPEGQVRIRIESDNRLVDTDEDLVHKVNPSRLNYAEDLAQLTHLNESSVLHVLQQRFGSQLVHTKAGPGLLIIKPSGTVANYSGKLFRCKRKEGMPPHVFGVAQKAYWDMLEHRRDQSIIPLGWSGAGKTTSCQSALEYIVEAAGSASPSVTVEKIQAMFTVLRAFGTVPAPQNNHTTRFSMVASLDFDQMGRVSSAHLQTMLLERIHVSQRPDVEGTFNVFHQMLAGLDPSFRTELHLHHMAESHLFGIAALPNMEGKQRASQAFSKLLVAMETLGFKMEEQRALWHVLAGIYHLGAAGVCKVGRRQFMKFEWAQNAADVLGCELEELITAVFKHHLKQVIQQATGKFNPSSAAESTTAPRLTGEECVEGMAAGLYEELFGIIVMLINRSFSSQQLSLTSIMVLDCPGFQKPGRGQERAATFQTLCHNYAQERLQAFYHQKIFVSQLERYKEEDVQLTFDMDEVSPLATVSVIDQISNLFKVQLPMQEESKGLLWILDEEVLVQDSKDSVVLDRLCAYFEKKGLKKEEKQPLRRCEQEQQFVISHQLGTCPVRYDLTGWINKAKPNQSLENASQLLQESRNDSLKKLFSSRSKIPAICRSVSGLEGTSQQSLHRISCVRKTFSSSFAAVKRKSVCALIKLQVDALVNLIKRSEAHFVHCFVARPEGGDPEGRLLPPQRAGDVLETPTSRGHSPSTFDIPTLRSQLQGSQLLDALRLYRLGFPDHVVFGDFRRRFQALAPDIVKKYGASFMAIDERKATEVLLGLLDLEKHSFTLGQSRIFFKAGVVSQLEKQRQRQITQRLIPLQALCQGLLGRQQFKKMKTQRLALRCIQKNFRKYLAVYQWSWWQLMSRVRPMLTINLANGNLQSKEEEASVLRKKLEKSDRERNEMRGQAGILEGKISDLTAELSDERFKGEVTYRVLEGERAERLRLTQELKAMQGKYEKVVRDLTSVEKQLEETLQQLQSRELGTTVTEEEWKMQYDCTQMEMEFLKKRIHTFVERIESELQIRKELEQKLSDLQGCFDSAKREAQQLRRKGKRLSTDLEDTKVLMEGQQSRNHELEKKQKRFDMELAQALGKSAFEKTLREKVSLESQALRAGLYRAQQDLQAKESEAKALNRQIGELRVELRDLTSREPQSKETVAQIKKQLRQLEASTQEQSKEISERVGTIEQLEQTLLRCEVELARMEQIHSKELEDKEEELEDVRRTCQRRLRQLEMQLEQEFEERQLVLHEKQDLESLVGTLCEQIGHRDFDVEKRLRRDLRRKNALLVDAQLLLGTMQEPGQSGNKLELERLQLQLQESRALRAETENDHKSTLRAVGDLQIQLEDIQRDKKTVDEQLYQLEREKSDLLRRLEEDQEDLNELMKKHKDLIAQSSSDIAQIQELQTQLKEVVNEKQNLGEKLQVAQSRIDYMENSMVERGIVSQQEAIICDLENKLEFQRSQLKRFETLVLRLRDSVVRMGEELEQAAEGEAREREMAGRFQQRVEEMKVEMDELAQREMEASRKGMELGSQVESLVAMNQTLQADLETSIKRIADLQTSLEEVSSDESDDEAKRDKQSSVGSLLTNDRSGATRSWLGSSAGRSPTSGPSVAGSLAQGSAADSASLLGYRSARSEMDQVNSRASSSKSGSSYRSRDFAKSPEQRRPPSEGERPPPSSSVALSEFLEELRRKRVGERDQLGLPMDEASTLPIYQTAGMSSLRKRPALEVDDGGPLLGPEARSLSSLGGRGCPGLVRSLSLRSLPAAGDDATDRRSRYGSCEMLAAPIAAGQRPSVPPRPRPRTPPRKWLGLEEDIDVLLAGRPMVFKSKRFSPLLAGEGPDSEASSRSWTIPSLSYERGKGKASGDGDILPAIRRSQGPPDVAHDNPGHLSSDASLDKGPPGPAWWKKTMVVRPRSSEGDREPHGNLSDSDSSSGSTVSYKSADSVKNRPGGPRPRDDEEEGGNGGLNAQPRDAVEVKSETNDINSVMMKYLKKPDKE
ncbi:unconventional myosin-XVIIIb [Amblyraja radiata]|uniref:unconventional myosin-XVIIIb n=1 Tax=Amblyraja radiata TaxID=386614 RepID=UPI0014041545|nr:unconventional myosin-XVIIIb [Amblyraja radiata]